MALQNLVDYAEDPEIRRMARACDAHPLHKL
jgi:hypothetical protein